MTSPVYYIAETSNVPFGFEPTIITSPLPYDKAKTLCDAYNLREELSGSDAMLCFELIEA